MNFYKEESRRLIFGAYDGNQLVGITFGHREAVKFDNRLELEIVNIGLTAVDPEYRQQGISKQLIARLEEQAKVEGIDFLLSFPIKDRFGDKICESLGFTKFGKTEHLIKLMESEGMKSIKDYNIITNPVLLKVAGLYAKIPDLVVPDAVLRDGKPDDVDQVLGILNSYQSRVPLSMIYLEDDYLRSNQGFSSLNERFGEPWNFYFKVLEQDNKIIATISYRIEKVTFFVNEEYPDGYVALCTSLAYHEDFPKEMKKPFIAMFLREIRNIIPDVFLTQITSPQHEMKALNSIKFLSDFTTYFLYMKPLTEKAEELFQKKKYKEYLMQYYR